MSKVYYLDIGINDPTIIYELVPVEVARFQARDMQHVAQTVRELDGHEHALMLVDGPHPTERALREYGISTQHFILNTPLKDMDRHL